MSQNNKSYDVVVHFCTKTAHMMQAKIWASGIADKTDDLLSWPSRKNAVACGCRYATTLYAPLIACGSQGAE